MKSYTWRFYLCYADKLITSIAPEKYNKRIRYGIKYSGTRFLSTEN